YDDWMVWVGYIALYVATVLTYWSMAQYLMAAKDDLLDEKHH
ncbi:CDP-diacylglycerol--glycerol-3-phosphate 3-phosphatidyltransferase, partial [Vibrio sp. 10N.261.48.A2]